MILLESIVKFYRMGKLEVPAEPSARLARVSSGFQALSVRTVEPRFVWSGRPSAS